MSPADLRGSGRGHRHRTSRARRASPNTLTSDTGEWTGNVDFGDLAVGDRWADLAIASMSIEWNFGEGHQGELFDAYGIDADQERIAYYRTLWDLKS